MPPSQGAARPRWRAWVDADLARRWRSATRVRVLLGEQCPEFLEATLRYEEPLREGLPCKQLVVGDQAGMRGTRHSGGDLPMSLLRYVEKMEGP